MRHLLSLLLLVVLLAPASAHFIWLVPAGEKEPGTALMVFSDDLQPDPRVPIAKIAGTKLLARAGAKGEAVDIKKSELKDAYRVQVEGEGLLMLAGSCNMGVRNKGRNGDTAPFLLQYYPKTIVRKGKQTVGVPWLFESTPELALEILPVMRKGARHQVLWQGKPAPGVPLTLFVPGIKEPVETKTDAQGQFEVTQPKDGGTYAMRASYVEKKSGEHEGQKYDEIRHHATFAFAVPEWLVPRDRKKAEAK